MDAQQDDYTEDGYFKRMQDIQLRVIEDKWVDYVLPLHSTSSIKLENHHTMLLVLSLNAIVVKLIYQIVLTIF